MIDPAQFADHYQPNFGRMYEAPFTRERLESLPRHALEMYEKLCHEEEVNAKLNPITNGIIFPMWRKVQENFKKYQFHVLLGGNRCVRGDTMIYDHMLNAERRIDEIRGRHYVLAWDGKGVVPAEAQQPFVKAFKQAMVEVAIADATGPCGAFAATKEHRLLTEGGEWIAVGAISVGVELKSPWHKACRVIDIKTAGSHDVWDMTVPQYGNYIAAGVVHHNSGKSTFMSRMVTWMACTIPGAEVHAYQANSEKSINEQQRYVRESFPLSFNNIPTKKGVNHSLTWSQKNGFTDDVCIFPPHSGARRGGFIKFRNYAQFSDDPNTAESFKAHGIWFDEECPADLFNTAPYRCVDYRGKIFLSFTTIQGWSPLVQQLLGRTKTIEKRIAPLLGIELPTMQEAMFTDPKRLTGAKCCIYYFWTEDNCFIDVPSFRASMQGKPKDEIKARAYGVPVKSVTGVFDGFGEINIVPHEKLPWLVKPDYKVTHYQGIDPGGSKHWFMVWMAVDAADTWWIWAEWPDASYGEWALPGSGLEGKAGPAQKGTNKGIRDYIEIMRSIEDGVEVYERLIDPRAGAAQKQGEEGAVTIISDLDDAGLLPPVRPAPLTRSSSGGEIEVGLQLITNRLAYDANKKIDSINAPKIYISDRCVNVIYAMQNYTAKGGQGEACKDAVDCVRLMAVAGPEYIQFVADTGRTGVY